jgi:hypothetical protein
MVQYSMAGVSWIPALAFRSAGMTEERLNDTPTPPTVGLLPTERIAYSPIAGASRCGCQAAPAWWCGASSRRGMGHHRPMPRTVLTPPAGRRALARHPELGLARIRQPRRLLAHAEGVRRFQGAGDARDQRLGDRAYPQIVAAANERSWEFIGHGFTQRNMQKVEDERATSAARAR